jgi:hypothetical protein
VIGASKIARDITLQKRYERELRAARDAAEQARTAAERAREEAEKANRAKDHFLSILSHELRTPLTPVLAALGFIQHDGSLTPEMAEQIDMIRRNVQTEARLVDDLLDLTRISRGKIQLHFEVVDAHAVLRNVVGMCQQDIDSNGLTLTMSLRAKRFQVWADPGRFQQVILNLLSNAIKFTPLEGTITLRTSNENGTVRIEIIDTGIGIEPEVLPRLFRAFEQGEQTITRKFGGLGLGLSIVKSLVEMHKASVSATSEGTGKGSAFTLRVETVNSVQHASHSPAAGGEPSSKACRVLLVEDHVDTRHALKRLLTSFGCQVTTAGTVKEAVEMANLQSFDLLLSDIGLPDGSGTEVMRYMASRSGV